MSVFTYIAPCHFGLEAVLKREVAKLGLEVLSVDDGRVVFSGNETDAARANIGLRSAERILIRAGEFRALTYDELFEGTKAIPWEEYLPKNAKFWPSKAASVSPVMAPVSETLAAGIIGLTPWFPDRILVDPFCGSGTIPIEAAMIAKRIAPGLKRHFLSEDWTGLIRAADWKKAREEAQAQILTDALAVTDIQGYDIDARAVKAARENAEAAGVRELIHFQQRAVKELRHPKKYGFIITNPPYGERLEDRAGLPALYRQIGEAYGSLDSWSMYLITSYEDAEKYIGRKADRNRKIYNGMLKTYLYQYMGPKPLRNGKR